MCRGRPASACRAAPGQSAGPIGASPRPRPSSQAARRAAARARRVANQRFSCAFHYTLGVLSISTAYHKDIGMHAIEARKLVRRFGDFVAVNEVEFIVRQGEIFGFLGPNGAGKSTTINMLCTMLRPTAGTAVINGFDLVRQP